MRESEAAPELVDELNEISERWRGKDAASAASRWSSARTSRASDADFAARDRARRRRAAGRGFLRLVPCYGDEPGYSLDLMRREPDARQRHHRVPDRRRRRWRSARAASSACR